MTLYLTGAISNNPTYKEDFEKAYNVLTEAGYTVISPLRICREDWDWKGRMRQCIKAVALGSDALAVIPSACCSRRMEIELSIANALDMPVKSVEQWIKHKTQYEADIQFYKTAIDKNHLQQQTLFSF